MNMDKLKDDNPTEPLFEFRTFGRDFKKVAYLMSKLSVPVPEKLHRRTSKHPIHLQTASQKDLSTFTATQLKRTDP